MTENTAPAAATLAERFCADPEAECYVAPYSAVDTYAWDAGKRGGGPTNEMRFADGSVACSVEAGPWQARALRDDEKVPEAEQVDAPSGWAQAEGLGPEKFDGMDCRPLAGSA